MVHAVLDALSPFDIKHLDMPRRRRASGRQCNKHARERPNDPRSLRLCPRVLARPGDRSVARRSRRNEVLAGGHTLLPALKLRLASPELLIDIGGIGELKGIEVSETGIRIGPLTTHAELLASVPLNNELPIFRQAAALIADPQVRNRGTVGGSLANADQQPTGPRSW